MNYNDLKKAVQLLAIQTVTTLIIVSAVYPTMGYSKELQETVANNEDNPLLGNLIYTLHKEEFIAYLNAFKYSDDGGIINIL